MSTLLDAFRARRALAAVTRLTPQQRDALVAAILAEMPAASRQRLLVNSPGFVRFARAFLLTAGQQRPTG